MSGRTERIARLLEAALIRKYPTRMVPLTESEVVEDLAPLVEAAIAAALDEISIEESSDIGAYLTGRDDAWTAALKALEQGEEER